MKLFLPLIFFLSTTQAIAAITLNTNVSGASNYDFTVNNSTSAEELAPIIYGGLAGGDCSGADNTVTCNSCTAITSASGDMSCNENRIHDNLRLTIYFTSNSTTGYPAASVDDADKTSISIDNSSSLTQAGTQAFITITWSSLCKALTGDICSNFSGVIYQNINLGISTTNDLTIDSGDDFVKIKIVIANPTFGNISDCDTNNASGVCSLIVFPGDEKVYIEALEYAGSFPNIDSSVGIFKYRQARIMYSTDASTALPSNDYQDLTITNIDSETPDVSPDLVDGLNNGQTYHFRFGSIDDAGNLSNVWSSTTTAQPSKTAGLLAEDINCFIATAAFGSTLDSRLNSLRQFRSQYLLNSEVGRKFVKFYYNYSPALAEKIYHSKALKLAAQAFIWPAVLWVEAGLEYGFLLVNFLLIGLLTLLVLGFRRWQRC